MRKPAPRGHAAGAPLPGLFAIALVPLLFFLVIFLTRHARFGVGAGGVFKAGFVTVAALSHWAIYGSLLVTFALTLRPGREPLITAMARRMHGELSEEMLRYTRRVTFAWCCFFTFQLSLSLTLFCFAPLIVWSTFVNILDVPMVAGMFAAEYFCRVRCLRNPPRDSFSAILKMVTDPAGNGGKRLPGAAMARK